MTAETTTVDASNAFDETITELFAAKSPSSKSAARLLAALGPDFIPAVNRWAAAEFARAVNTLDRDAPFLRAAITIAVSCVAYPAIRDAFIFLSVTGTPDWQERVVPLFEREFAETIKYSIERAFDTLNSFEEQK